MSIFELEYSFIAKNDREKNSSLVFAITSDTLVMKSINVEGFFCGGWNSQNR